MLINHPVRGRCKQSSAMHCMTTRHASSFPATQVQFDTAKTSFTAEDVMRDLQSIMGDYATPASMQVGELLLSWDQGEVPQTLLLSLQRLD